MPTFDPKVPDRGAAFRQQILDVTQTEGESEVEPHCLVNDLGRETISAVADFLHALGYWAAESAASLKRRDNASMILRR